MEMDRRLIAVLDALQRIASSAGECSVVQRAETKVWTKVQCAPHIDVIKQHFEVLAEMGLIEIRDRNEDPKIGWAVRPTVKPADKSKASSITIV